MLPSLRQKLPPNAHRALLRAGGLSPWRAALFHSLNQRIDARFPRAVATFHDLFVMTGDYSTPEFRERFTSQARSAAERADLIIAVSEFTAQQVISLLNVERGRVRVIHHGARLPSKPVPEDGQRENLILSVGAIQTRKNTARLVEAFELTPPGWKLVLAGSAGYEAQSIVDRIERSPRRDDIELAGYVTDDRLESLYGRARMLAFPSLDEGFGMPVLDAMSRGVPVVTSNRSAMAEIAGDAAILVDPYDTQSIAGGLDGLILSPELRNQYRERGLKRAAGFKWELAVEKTWRVYRELF